MKTMNAAVALLAACGLSCTAPSRTLHAENVLTNDAALSADTSIWPNTTSYANSDPWLVANHTSLKQMQPRVLIVNFANSFKTADDVLAKVKPILDGLKEGSRYHGYSDGSAPAFVDPQYHIVNLADGTSSPNSALVPVKNKPGDQYQFDYGALFDQDFANRYGFDTGDASTAPLLCDLFAQGRVHEVWVMMDPSGPGMAEVLEYKQKYDANGQSISGQFDPSGGNGTFDADDAQVIARCGLSVRIAYINPTRGPGCLLHSLGHGMEAAGRSGGPLPTLAADFAHFGNFDLRTAHGLSFDSWYALPSGGDGSSFDNTSCPQSPMMTDAQGKLPMLVNCNNSVVWRRLSNDATTVLDTGTLDPFNQGCGNVHFPPNARTGYDTFNPCASRSTCEHFGLHDGPNGADALDSYTNAKSQKYENDFGDCGGGWLVYWMQSFPGLDNAATGANGAIKNWWVYPYY